MDVDELIARLAREATELLPGNTPVRLAGQPATDATPRTGPHFLAELARAFEELPDLFATARGLAYLQGQEETDGGSDPMPDDQDDDLREWWRAEHAKLVLLAEIPGVGSDVVAARAQRLVEREASTQLSAARTEGVTLAANRLGWVLVLVPERDACLVCASYAGSVVEPGGLFAAVRDFTAGTLSEDGVSVPVHPWCLPGEALVSTVSRITGLTSRVYDGELVTIRTLTDQELTATPNHPVLTDRGWVAVGLLREGDRVVRASGSEGPLSGDDHDQDVVAPIGQVADAFLAAREVTACEVPVSAVDFHGDAADGEVAVVGTYRDLARELSGQVLGEQRFPGAVEHTGRDVRLPARGLTAPLAETDDPTTRGGVGCRHEAGALLGGGLRHSGVHPLRPVPDAEPLAAEYTTDGRTADPLFLGELLDAYPGRVALDEIIHVRRDPFSGHVFNLETESGWYIGSGIVTHNCRCDVRAVAPEDADLVADPLRREAERSVLRFDALPSESDRARTEAAKRLIDSGTRLSKTVIQRSAVAIRRRDKAAAKVVADRAKARAKAAKARARERARLRKKRAPLLKRKRALEQELRRLRRQGRSAEQ